MERFKKHTVLFLIGMIERIVNSKRLVSILNFISTKFLLLLQKRENFSSDLFKNLSIAFIADGNRRWMNLRQAELLKEFKDDELIQEHKVRVGSEKIAEIVKFAHYYKMKEVSFYCFSLKNFSRPKDQVDGIMNYLKKYGVIKREVPFKFKAYGRLDLLDVDVRKVFLEMEEETKECTGLKFNFFFCYSSSDDENSESPYKNKVDLLVRTSGEKRLSDFMVRQVASGTAVEFIKPMWPEFSLIHLYLILLKFKLEDKFLFQMKMD